MRPPCIYCALKHIGQAEVLMGEVERGYPLHKWLAVGHISEAEEEILYFSKELANEIRNMRVSYMHEDGYKFPSIEVLEKITELDSLKELQPEHIEKINEMYEKGELPTENVEVEQFTDFNKK